MDEHVLISPAFPLRVALAAMFVVAAGAAHAVCPGLDELLVDDFDDLAPVWGEAGPTLRAEEGVLFVSPASGSDFWRANDTGLFDDVDMCLTVTVVAGIDPTEAKAGAIFWFEDVNNFYVFQLAPNRMLSVWRRQRGKWLEQVPWQAADAANEGDGGSNELRVTTRGGEATFFVNGAELATIEGAPPERGQQIGIFASSPDDGRAVFAFDALRVTRP